VHQTFDKKLNIKVLGGKTGSGKTVVLKKLAELGEQVIDLEAMQTIEDLHLVL
jgi:tRNA 2-selenouridine synthase